MNKLVIFDLDGVLIDSKDWHYYAFNNALKKLNYPELTYDEHLSSFDGLSTKMKLRKLISENRVQANDLDKIELYKQIETQFYIRDNVVKDEKLIAIFDWLKYNKYKIAIASNSIASTIYSTISNLGIIDKIDLVVSNQCVSKPKPFPEIYWKCMTNLNCLPKDTIIIEDSFVGRKGALDSGANLLEVENSHDLTLEKIKIKIDSVLNGETKVMWKDDKLNVLIPMAGLGSRFAEKGYSFPKPLIDVNGKPMIQVVVENLNIDANYIFLVQKDHYVKYKLNHLLNLIKPGCTIVQVDGLTEGAACTALLAKEYINNDSSLLIANSDQYIEWDSSETMYSFTNSKLDGGMLVFNSVHPKWSFAELNSDGLIDRVAEKDPISNIASTGIYFYKKGSDFVKYAEQMIRRNIRVNNEFYICPVYNEFINDGKKLNVKYVDKMYGIGTPEDLGFFLTIKK